VKLGILCENYYPTLGGEQEHIFNLRRHLESPADGADPVDVRVIVPHVAYDVWHGPPDDAHVLRPAHSIRVHGEGSASQITITPSAYGAMRRLFARERFDLLHIHAPVDIGLSAWARFWRIEAPFATPPLIWNMMMSMSGGWFFVTVSEAISVGNTDIALPGIGSWIAVM